MNQEQNNLNPNSFNTQGNNGIPNNQPLNNQNFNTTFNQNVEPNTNVNQTTFNQQAINSQPQSTPSFQQPIMQEPTPQPMNTLESGNASNQKFNNKPPKKVNLGLIIGIVVAVVVIIGGILLFINKKNNNSSKSSINKNFSGKTKLVNTYANIDTQTSTENTNQIHFSIGDVDVGDDKVIDISGNTIVNAEYSKRTYLGDEYYAVNKDDNIVIIKNNHEIFSFVDNANLIWGNLAYKSGVLYYTIKIDNQKYVVAYSLTNKKELWKVKGESPFVLENNNIVVSSYNSYSIVNQNGNIIAAADKDTKVYPTATDYYFKIVNNVIEIYNNSSKISELSLETKNKVFYTFVSALSNGMFVIKEFDSNTWKTIYKVYDKDLKLITELDDCKSFEGNVLGRTSLMRNASPYNSSDKSIIPDAIESETGSLDVIIYSNGTIEKLYASRFEDGLLSSETMESTDKTKHYIIGIETSNGVNGIKIINLDNNKNKKVTDGSWTADGIAESPNGKYVIINYNTTYNDSKNKIVLDENLKSLYETENQLEVVNDKFVIEYSLKSKSEIYLVNVFTKEKTKLDTTGDYYDNNSVGLITSNKGSYNLYSLN